MRRASHRADAERLRAEREAIARDVAAACLDACSEAELAALLAGPAGSGRDELVKLHQQLVERLSARRAALHQLLEERGQLAAQIQSLADDRGLGRKQLELGMIEQRLAEAVERWRVLAVTESVLRAIREDYHRNRQPEALREASRYLSRLTGGRYVRVWTPLDEETLRVDDPEGRPLGVERLSRGAREQLFLSLRLALVGWYARQGAAMPLVLDDVLVNFDTERTNRATAVLRDFAAEGHQLLVFTCHEHMARQFESLGVRVRWLPGKGERPDFAPLEEEPKEKEAAAITEPVAPWPSPPLPPPPPLLPPPPPAETVVEIAPPRRRPRAVKPRIMEQSTAPVMLQAEPEIASIELSTTPPKPRAPCAPASRGSAQPSCLDGRGVRGRTGRPRRRSTDRRRPAGGR